MYSKALRICFALVMTLPVFYTAAHAVERGVHENRPVNTFRPEERRAINNNVEKRNLENSYYYNQENQGTQVYVVPDQDNSGQSNSNSEGETGGGGVGA